MKTRTLLLSGLLTLASVTAIAGQAHAAVETDGQSGTSVVTAELIAPKTPVEDNLKLTAVPDLDFGTKEITDSALTLDQTADDTKNTNISVTDSRGTGKGYSVNVALTTPFTAGAHVLTGSTLTLTQEGGEPGADTTGTGTDGKTTTAFAADPTGANATNIVTAAEGTGMGNWNYNVAGSQLKVLAGAYADKYTGTLTWTLAATDSTPGA